MISEAPENIPVPPASELMAAIGFDAEDLTANQRGQLSSAQRDHLYNLRMRNLLIGAVVFLVTTLLATTLLYWGDQRSSLILHFTGVLLVIINAILVGMFGRAWMRLSADMRGDGQLETIDGPLERVVRPSGRINNYVLRIEGVDFVVKKDLFKLFRHQQRYRLYRSQHARILLGAEPITQD